jgi:hypothetical protein
LPWRAAFVAELLRRLGGRPTLVQVQ